MRADHLGSLRFVVDEVVDLGDRPIEHRDLVAVVVHVQHQVLAHDRQANQSNIASCLSHLNLQSDPSIRIAEFALFSCRSRL